MKKMDKKGFTLIELLAVIVILAIIMVIAVPQILNVIENSRESAWKSNVKMIADGIELGKKLRERSYQTLIIYVSGYDQYMRQLFEAEPFRFLSKPLKQEELENVLDKAFERISRFHRELFTIRFGKNVVNLLCRDIVYLESNKRKVIVHTVRGEYEYYHKLDEAEEELLAISADFVRIHKAYLVNMEHVEAFQYEKLALRDGTILSISEAHRANVRSRFWEWDSE